MARAELPLTAEEHAQALVAGLDGRELPLGPLEAVRAMLAALPIIEATTVQSEYEAAARGYFAQLESFDRSLARARWLGGAEVSVADLWLFAALVRHDPVYVPFYKLSLHRVDDFEHLGHYLRDLYQQPGWSQLADQRAIRKGYARRSETLNPKLKVPRGGLLDLWAPHDRFARFGGHPDADGGTNQAPTLGWTRPRSRHRSSITPSGAHPVERGRYHLYVAHNCPWSHRVALARAVLGLEDAVSMDVAFYRRDPERGWQFRPQEEGCTPDTLFGSKYIREIYEREGSGEKSVPILFDKVADCIVSNESADIVRMFGTALSPLGHGRVTLYPEARRLEIDLLNQWIYQRINNGAYRAGFSNDQTVYEDAEEGFFTALAGLEARLADGRPFLCGDELSEADLRLFPTLYRFNEVYFVRFLLNRHKLSAFPHLDAWKSRMLELDGVRRASRMDHCKKGYFGRTGNGLVPLDAGP